MYIPLVPSLHPQPLMGGGALNRERLIISLGIHDVINAGAGRKRSVSSAGKTSWRWGVGEGGTQAAVESRAATPRASHQTSRASGVSPSCYSSLSKTASNPQLFNLSCTSITWELYRWLMSGSYPQRPLFNWPRVWPVDIGFLKPTSGSDVQLGWRTSGLIFAAARSLL